MRHTPVLLGVLCVLGANSFFSTAQAAAPAQEALQKFVDGVQTLSADFEQVQKDEKGEVLQTTSGRMWLSRPGKFRWSYEKPYQQLLVCDGKSIWMYDPDLAQVTVREARTALAGTPAELLAQRSDLAKQFRIEDAGQENGARIVRLLPKSADGDFQSIELWLRAGTPQRMRFADPLGGSSEVRFTRIKVNAAAQAGQYRFDIPEGVEVIRAESPGSRP